MESNSINWCQNNACHQIYPPWCQENSFYMILKRIMIYYSVSILGSVILKTSSFISSLLKNLSRFRILLFRLMWQTWRPQLINLSTQQAYFWNVLKLPSWNFATSNYLAITAPFMLIIWRRMLRPFKDILVVIFILIHLYLRFTSCDHINPLLRPVILIISNTGVHELYYENHTLFSSTKLRIYNKDKHDRVKLILFYKSAMESNTLFFDPTEQKYFTVKLTRIKFYLRTYKQYPSKYFL